MLYFKNAGLGNFRDTNGKYPAWGWLTSRDEAVIATKCIASSNCVGYYREGTADSGDPDHEPHGYMMACRTRDSCSDDDAKTGIFYEGEDPANCLL